MRDGWFTLQIAKLARHVVAIDIDTNLLDEARQIVPLKAVSRIAIWWECYELAHLWPKWSILCSWQTLSWRTGSGAGWLVSVHSALAPSGLFAVVNWHQRLREETTVLGEPRGPRTELRMSPEQTARSVEAGGLKLVRIVEVPPYHYGAVFKRPAS